MTVQEQNARVLEELWELGESLFDPAEWQGWLIIDDKNPEGGLLYVFRDHSSVAYKPSVH